MGTEDLVFLARIVLQSHFGKKYSAEPYEMAFPDKQGAFVTIHTYPDNHLRGCIGYMLPLFPLAETIERAAYAAAFDDPRFPSLREEELDRITIEISLLTVPQPLECKPEDRVKSIRIGIDGLIIEYHGMVGLLLPQVAVENNLSAEEFLADVALKAGIRPDKVFDPEAKISTFQAEIWHEETPKGIVKKEQL